MDVSVAVGESTGMVAVDVAVSGTGVDRSVAVACGGDGLYTSAKDRDKLPNTMSIEKSASISALADWRILCINSFP
jgi:hypothetical protein